MVTGQGGCEVTGQGGCVVTGQGSCEVTGQGYVDTNNKSSVSISQGGYDTVQHNIVTIIYLSERYIFFRKLPLPSLMLVCAK